MRESGIAAAIEFKKNNPSQALVDLEAAAA